jgi:TonB family protein
VRTVPARRGAHAALVLLALALALPARGDEGARAAFEQAMAEITRDLPRLVVTSTHRTEADQERLRRAGYAPHPHSQHKLGLAWDLAAPPEALRVVEQRAREQGFVALAMRSPVTGSAYLHVQRHARSPRSQQPERDAPARIDPVAWDPRVTPPIDVSSAGPAIDLPRPIAAGLELPRRLRERPARGTVVLRVTIGAEGEVQDVEVDVSDLPRFDAFVAEAVRGWRFTPPLRDGQPIAAVARLPIPIHVD